MDVRHLLAYLMIAALVAVAIGLTVYLRYHSRSNRLRRQRLREDAWRRERLDAAAGD